MIQGVSENTMRVIAYLSIILTIVFHFWIEERFQLESSMDTTPFSLIFMGGYWLIVFIGSWIYRKFISDEQDRE